MKIVPYGDYPMTDRLYQPMWMQHWRSDFNSPKISVFPYGAYAIFGRIRFFKTVAYLAVPGV